MENELFNILFKELHLPFGIVLAGLIELFKLCMWRLDCGKYAFRFDTEARIKFNLRFAIIGFSLLFFLAILAIERTLAIVPNLIITFFVANFFYEYFLKHILKQLQIRN